MGMNPRDIMTDAIHNFHPQYQQYTQYSSTASTKGGHKRNGSYEGVDSNEPPQTQQQSETRLPQPTLTVTGSTASNNEKTLLLSDTEDEFQ